MQNFSEETYGHLLNSVLVTSISTCLFIIPAYDNSVAL